MKCYFRVIRHKGWRVSGEVAACGEQTVTMKKKWKLKVLAEETFVSPFLFSNIFSSRGIVITGNHVCSVNALKIAVLKER